MQALKDWQEKRPKLFKKKVYNLTGLDSYTFSLGNSQRIATNQKKSIEHAL